MVDLAVSGPVEPPSRWLASFTRGGPRLWVGVGLVGFFVFIALNLVVDVLVTLLDPRLRHG